jgi:hypothetical protein
MPIEKKLQFHSAGHYIFGQFGKTTVEPAF